MSNDKNVMSNDKNALSAMLKNRSKETGRVALQGQTEGTKPVEKANDKNALSAMLGKHKAESDKKREQVNTAVMKTVETIKPLDLTTAATGKVPKWSMSRLHNYENCPYILQKATIEREKTPDSPAAARGSAIHDECEQWVRGQRDELKGDRQTNMGHFRPKFNALKAKFAQGIVELEENWGFMRDWSPCAWGDKELWGRAKLDALIHESPTSLTIIDYKTGRKMGNEVKHGEQGLTYALICFHRYPDVDHFRVEFWYLDQSETMIRNFTREQLSVLLARINNRAVRMTTDRELAPTPSEKACRFCDYGCNTNKAGRAYGIGTCDYDYYKGYEVI